MRYDLAIVAVMKCEGHYLKEWLDYHLKAGVDHFFIYDNDSPDNQAEVAKPYVKAGLVDYLTFHGRAIQLPVYNDALKRFRNSCRYMAFVDGDEFIFPKQSSNIVHVVDDILSDKACAASLAIHWQHFGSNGHEKADYSRGVLERFTRRAPLDWFANEIVKPIFMPQHVLAVKNIHAPILEYGFYTVDESGRRVSGVKALPVRADVIALNHYCKSREEYLSRRVRGDVLFRHAGKYSNDTFNLFDRNDVFDDAIIRR